MRLFFHILFTTLLLQDAFCLSNEPLNASVFFSTNNKNENCSDANKFSNGFFNYISCAFTNFFPNTFINSKNPKAINLQNKQIEELKKKLAEIANSESDKLKKEAHQKVSYWNKLLEKSRIEQIHKLDKYSKDQLEKLEKKEHDFLFANIFNFSENEDENEKEKEKEKEKENQRNKDKETITTAATTTKGINFWPFSSSRDSKVKVEKKDNETNKEQESKKKSHSFFRFFKTEKKETEELKEPKEKKETESSSWWFSPKNEETIPINESTDQPTKDNNLNTSDEISFWGVFSKNKKSEIDIETKETNEEKPKTQRWFNPFSKENLKEKYLETDTEDSIKKGEVTQEENEQNKPWWNLAFQQDTTKEKKSNDEKRFEIKEQKDYTEQTEPWWNLSNITSFGDSNPNKMNKQVEEEEEGEEEEKKKKNEENEQKKKHESDSVFNLWGYSSSKGSTKAEEKEDKMMERQHRNEDASHIEKEKIEDKNIYNDSTFESTYFKSRNQEEEIAPLKEEDKEKDNITSLFHFNKAPQKDIEAEFIKEEEAVSTPDENKKLNVLEKIYNFNLDEIQDDNFLALLNEKHENEENINCHPLIVFKVCVYKCFKTLPNEHNEDIGKSNTIGDNTNNIGLSNNDYKLLEKCIMKCKKISFDTIHGGCIQKNGKLINKKESFKDSLEEMQNYNLQLDEFPTDFSDFSLKDKYIEHKRKKSNKYEKNNILKGKLNESRTSADYIPNILPVGIEGLNLQMLNRNSEKTQTLLQDHLNKINKKNGINYSGHNMIPRVNTIESDNNNNKGFIEKSMNFFRAFTNKGQKENEGTREVIKEKEMEKIEPIAESEKIEFLNNETYTISDDAIQNEIYARSNGYISTIFFLILIVLSVCIYFSVFTSIISQCLSTCTEEITSFIKGSYVTTYEGMSNSPKECFLNKNEKSCNYYNMNLNLPNP